MGAMKPKQVRLNLNEECQTLFAELVDHAADLPESQLATLIMTAGLRALAAERFTVRLPLRFVVVQDDVAIIPSARR